MYLNRFKLPGRTALITGGGRGIGLACADALAEAGARVIIADRDPAIAESGLAFLRQKGHRAEAIILDVTDSRHVDEVAAQYASQGGVDILVANAGIARSGTAAEDVTDEHWLNVIDVNLNAVFWCCRSFGKHMLAAGRGSIVNVGSMSGFIVNKPQAQSYYNASKAAVHHLTKSLAAEWAARGVRVNAVAPTYISTPLNKFVEDDPAMGAAWLGGTPRSPPPIAACCPSTSRSHTSSNGTPPDGPDGRRRGDRISCAVPGVGCVEPDDRQCRRRRRRVYLLVIQARVDRPNLVLNARRCEFCAALEPCAKQPSQWTLFRTFRLGRQAKDDPRKERG